MDDKFAIVVMVLMVTLVAILSGLLVVQEEKQKKFCCCNQSKSVLPVIGELGPGCSKINCSEVICQNKERKTSTSQSQDYDIST